MKFTGLFLIFMFFALGAFVITWLAFLPSRKALIGLPKSPHVYSVTLLGDHAEPEVLTIATNDFVQFLTKDGKNHVIAQGGGAGYDSSPHDHLESASASGAFGLNEGYKVQFKKVGVYDFHDDLNPKIFATVIVTETKK